LFTSFAECKTENDSAATAARLRLMVVPPKGRNTDECNIYKKTAKTGCFRGFFIFSRK